MKTYIVSRGSGGQVGCTVSEDGVAHLLAHCVCHSPDGFETGYGGSGPADLALSILCDFCGVEPTMQALAREDRPWRLHHGFKFQFIGPRRLEKGQSYAITGRQIAEWMATL
jgi:hypothetical protein